jgi:hypothetical protein
VDIHFEVDGRPARFRRNDWTGKADLSVGGKTFVLQSPWKLGTHFSLSTTRTWTHPVGNRLVEIVKERPRVAAGVRAASFTVLIDGEIVTQQKGK